MFNFCRSRGEEWVTERCYSMDFTMDKEYFYTFETLEAKYNGEVVFSKDYKNKVKRNGH